MNDMLSGRCLYRAERVYIDDAGVGHEVHLYATGHTPPARRG
ncbi:hypothetical protein [Streptomyces sp. NPDC001020]